MIVKSINKKDFFIFINLFIFVSFSSLLYSNLSFSDPKLVISSLGLVNDALEITSIDIDNDSDEDIIFTSESKGLILLENTGNGVFEPILIKELDKIVKNNFKIVDTDNDGDLDILLLEYFHSETTPTSFMTEIWWLENIGNNNFSEHYMFYDPTLLPISVSFEDMDGDGDVDLVGCFTWSLVNMPWSKLWFENDGQQNFYWTSFLAGSYSEIIYPIDFDLDNDKDFMAIYMEKYIFIYENDGNQNFTTSQVLENTIAPFTNFTIIDFDGDNDFDIITNSILDSGKVSWFEKNDDNSFTEHLVSIEDDNIIDVIAKDFDFDGDIDILTASSDSLGIDRIKIYLNEDNNLNFTTIIITTNELTNLKSIFISDLNADNILDILSASGDVSCFINNGVYSFNRNIILPNEKYVDSPTSVISIDLDNDGDNDIVSSSAKDNKIAWYENDGQYNFTQKIISINIINARSVFAIDLDRDNDIDIISASYDDDKVSWFENDGEEFFVEHIITDIADGVSSVYISDIDNDEDYDILSASRRSGGKLALYENDGNQNFIELIISNENTVCEISTIDMDNDGLQDIIYASEYNDSITWYKNLGENQFSSQFVSDIILGTIFIRAVDIDLDGDIDLVSNSSDGLNRGLSWYENDGFLNFEEHRIFSDYYHREAKSLIATDIDFDNDIDLIVTFVSFNSLQSPTDQSLYKITTLDSYA